MTMKEVKIMSGVSGSGKSTYARNLFSQCVEKGGWGRIVSADDYFMVADPETKEKVYKFDITKLSLAHGECFRRFIDACQRGCDLVIVDNTCTREGELAPYVLGGEAYGYRVTIFQFNCDPVVAHARNTHNLSLDAVMSQHNNIQRRTLPPWWALKIVRT